MWYLLFPIDGMTGKQAYPILKAAYDNARCRESELAKLEPENGFGCYDDFLDFLKDILRASDEMPDAVWRACR